MDDRQRFKDVVLPHVDTGLSLARWLTGNAADAEDVVQEACLRAFRAIPSVESDNPKAWLLAIVRNTAFTWMAKNRPKDVATEDQSLLEDAGPALRDRGPEAAMIAKVDAKQLHRAIAALPLDYREVLVLREIEDLSYMDIATVLSIPTGTVMSRLARARRLLIQRIHMAGRQKAGLA